MIAEVGSTRRLENLKQARAALEIDVHGSVVMPGFIDPSLRVSLNHDPHGAHRPKRMGKLYDETLDLLRSCVLHGTLSAELKGTAALADYRSDLGVLRRLAKIGNNPARTVRCWQLTHVPQSEAETPAFCEILLKLARKSLIHFVELPLDNDTVLSEGLLSGLQEAGVGIKLLWTGSSATALGRALNQLHPFALFCVKPLRPEELVVLQSYAGTVVFAPGRGLGDPGLLGAREAMEAGLAVALSSGYDAVSFPGYSMQMAVSLASVYGHLNSGAGDHRRHSERGTRAGVRRYAGMSDEGPGRGPHCAERAGLSGDPAPVRDQQRSHGDSRRRHCGEPEWVENRYA